MFLCIFKVCNNLNLVFVIKPKTTSQLGPRKNSFSHRSAPCFSTSPCVLHSNPWTKTHFTHKPITFHRTPYTSFPQSNRVPPSFYLEIDPMHTDNRDRHGRHGRMAGGGRGKRWRVAAVGEGSGPCPKAKGLASRDRRWGKGGA